MPDLDAVRYARQLALPGFGPLAQRRLEGARVLVAGAGGLGSVVITSLAAAGVGTIGVIDDDVVETSNLPRQTLHRPVDVGRRKTDSAAEAIARINPATRVELFPERLAAARALDLFAAYDLVVDGSDNFPTRYLTDDAATLTGIPCVWGAVHQYAGRVGLSWAAHGPTYRDLFPVPPEPGTVGSCEESGVLPTVCAVVGGIMASEVVKLLTGIGEPMLGRVISYDARNADMRTIRYARDPSAEPVRELIDYELFCGAGSAAVGGSASASARGTHRVAEPDVAQGESPDAAQAGSPDAAYGTSPDAEPHRALPAPSPVSPEISAAELAATLGSADQIQLLDVREEWEAALVRLPGSTLIPLGELAFRAGELDSEIRTVVYCHSGYRSEYARQLLASLDFVDVRSLAGGIDEWSRVVDPSMARY